MNLSTVKSITIPAGNVTALSIGGVKVWGGGSNGDEPAELLSWEGVAYHINKGTYKDVYAIGDMVPLDLGSEGLINMQVAAFDADTLADGSGKAPMTLIAKELLKTTKRMNPAVTSATDDSGATVYTEGTGAIGGWEKSEMRSHLMNTIKPMIPANVAGMIKPVTKTQLAYDTAGSHFVQTTLDELWVPGQEEVAKDGLYRAFFIATGYSKYIAGQTTSTIWWLRTASSTNYYYRSAKTGLGTGNAKNVYGVCLGFCVGKTPT